MSGHRDKLLAFLDDVVGKHEKILLSGVGGETVEQRMVNYSAKIAVCKELRRFREQVSEIMDSDPDDDKLPVMEEER